ncbi:hypothetical protein HAX54_024046 [Datura stramonium]|uniref:Uncharacterized protein n=1 Tax=Datura stramonium TaxID=4076 RepID=A0ABS8UXD6_DATST|nr:hypothetical protein [Datura stramonium]
MRPGSKLTYEQSDCFPWITLRTSTVGYDGGTKRETRSHYHKTIVLTSHEDKYELTAGKVPFKCQHQNHSSHDDFLSFHACNTTNARSLPVLNKNEEKPSVARVSSSPTDVKAKPSSAKPNSISVEENGKDHHHHYGVSVT